MKYIEKNSYLYKMMLNCELTFIDTYDKDELVRLNLKYSENT